MANITVTYSFTNGTTADASQVNQNFTDIINGTSDGTKDFSISALTVAGTLTANGNVTLGNASGDDITFTGSLASSIPIKTTRTYDIGSADLGLRILYLAGNSTHTVALQAPSSGMSGDYSLSLPAAAATNVGFGLQASSTTALTWAPMQTDINSVSSADYTVTDSDGYSMILVTTGSSNRTVTLPTAADNTDRTILVKKADSGSGYVIVDGESTETIDGSANKRLVNQYDYISIKCDGTSWHILAMGGSVENHIRVNTGNGYGSTNTKIRRFTNNHLSSGSAVTYADSAGDGASFTINQDGIYTMHYSDLENTASAGTTMGISLNSNQLTTNIQSVNEDDCIALLISADSGTAGQFVSATRRLAVGDVIRPHTDGGVDNASNRVAFSITQIRPC